MPEDIKIKLSEKTEQKIQRDLLAGNHQEVEKYLDRRFKKAKGEIVQGQINKIINSEAGYKLAKTLKEQHGYGVMRKKREMTVTIGGGARIKVDTWYAVDKQKPRGPIKKGPNGRGKHLLLSYWGYVDKYSLDYAFTVVRSGVASISYDLAVDGLREQGYTLKSNQMKSLTKKVGDIAQKHRGTISLSKKDDFAGKRISIAIDGGRSRLRETKRGRPRVEHQQVPFDTPWKEPKLLVIAELDENGKKKPGSKPIYEATLGDADEIFVLLEQLTDNCNLAKAAEIILAGDGAPWLWERYEAFCKKHRIKGKSTQILDWYHASGHLSELTKVDTSLSKAECKRWYKQLRKLLKAGRYTRLKSEIYQQADKKDLAEMKDKFKYFEKHRNRIKYHRYKASRQPIGSGIVESAIRRVINLRLKSPSSFWKSENLERMLQLRCILMSGRWRTFKDNFLDINRLTLQIP
jgi:hypothetical protein